MIKYYWDYVPDGEHKWILPIILDKNIPIRYTKKPEKDVIDKIEAVFKFLKGTRNFILLVSNRTAFVNSLFYYLGITWMTTTNKTFDIVDLGNIKEDYTLYQKMEHTNLLMVPYVNTDSYSLREVRDRIGAILVKRMVRNMPTIIEMYSRTNPKQLKQKDILTALQTLSSIYGESCAGTFLDKTGGVKILKLGG